DLSLPSYHLRGDGGCGLDGLAWRHAILNQIGKFGGLRAMRERTNSRAEGDLEAAGNRQPAAFFPQLLQAVFSASGFGIARGIVAEGIVISGKLQINALLLYLVRGGFV